MTLDDGAALAADLVVTGVGVRPGVALAEAAGLARRQRRRGRRVPRDQRAGRLRRGRHRALARSRTRRAHPRRALGGRRAPGADGGAQHARRGASAFDAVPFFWSQHYDVAISLRRPCRAVGRVEVDGQPRSGATARSPSGWRAGPSPSPPSAATAPASRPNWPWNVRIRSRSRPRRYARRRANAPGHRDTSPAVQRGTPPPQAPPSRRRRIAASSAGTTTRMGTGTMTSSCSRLWWHGAGSKPEHQRTTWRCGITEMITPRAGKHSRAAEIAEWAWVELNYRPHAYQACALTT